MQQGCSSRVGHSGRHISIGKSLLPTPEITTVNGALRRQTTGGLHTI